MSAPTSPTCTPDTPQPGRPPCDTCDDDGTLAFLAAHDPVETAAAEWLVHQQHTALPQATQAALQADFEAWLAADPAHGTTYRRLHATWTHLEALSTAGRAAAASPPASAVAETSVVPGTPPPAARLGGRPSGLGRWRLSTLALAAVLLCCAWLLAQSLGPQADFTQRYHTARGQQQEIALPDGSTLWLDTDTHVEVALYPDRRRLTLDQGQVMLDVHRAPQRPLNVLAGPARITVLGTRFDVRHVDGASTSVAVASGRVQVASTPLDAPAPRTTELLGGQSMTVLSDGRHGAIIPVTPQSVAAWHEGRLNFNDTPLAQALAEFERYGPTGLIVSDPRVATLRVTGSFGADNHRQFARALTQVLPVGLIARPQGLTEIILIR